MPYKIEREESGVRQRFIGTVKDDDLEQAATSLYGDKRFDRIRYIIDCFLQTEDFHVNTRNLKRIGHLTKAAALTNPHIKVALVIPEMDPVKAAIINAAFSEYAVWPTEIFPSLEKARSWLEAA